MKNTHLKQYMNDWQKVEGFCPEETFHVLDHLHNIVNAENCLEIGVHHGQLFIALNQCVTGKSYAVDVFDDQHLNIDKSGRGDKEKLLENLRLYDHKHQGENVVVIHNDSLKNNVFNDVPECDFISVDGGHTVAHVVNDLKTAESLMTLKGVIILDDYFNHWWPSVTEGVMKHFTSSTPRIAPFCSSRNKLWLCHVSYHNFYYDTMKQINNFGKTDTKLFGFSMIDLW